MIAIARQSRPERPLSNREWVRFASDGRQALLDTIKTPMLDGDGRLIRVLGIGRDITADHQTQAALAQRVKEVATLYGVFRATGVPIATSRPCCAGSCRYWAPGCGTPRPCWWPFVTAGDSYGASLPADMPALAIPFDGDAGLLRIVRRRGVRTSKTSMRTSVPYANAIAERLTGTIRTHGRRSRAARS